MQLSLLFAGAVAASTPSGVSGLHQHLRAGLDRDPQKFPALCDSSIVAETCELFGGKAVAPRDVAVTLAAADDAVLGLWQTLKLQGSQMGAAQEETCANMCDAVVKFFREQSTLPPTSDAGCYHAADGRAVCDVDLSPSALRGLVPADTPIPASHEHPGHGTGGNSNSSRRLLASSRPSLKSRANGSSIRAVNLATVQYDTRSLARRVANLFRIYPMLDNDLRGTPSGGVALALVPADWKGKLEEIGNKAQAYVSTAVKQMKVRGTGPSMKKWFGEESFTDDNARKEIARVLNSIANVLSKTSYVYPGSHCDDNTAGYVETSGGDGTFTDDGKFIVFMCKMFFEVELPVQIETLTHEASHHSAAYTEDICLSIKPVYLERPVTDFADENLFGDPWPVTSDDGEEIQGKAMLVKGDNVVMRKYTAEEENCPERAYSRPVCEKLAKDDRIGALRNADSYCYYIQDITDAPKP